MRKYFLLSLVLNLLLFNFVIAKDGSEYFIDQSNFFANKIVDRREIIKDLEEINQNHKIKVKILILNLLNSDNLNKYCEDGGLILVYSRQDNQLNIIRCPATKLNFNVSKSVISDEELNYIINNLVRPNIDNGNLVFALRIALREISRASRENILSGNYKIKSEAQEAERGKQIIVWLFVLILFSWLAACLGRTKSWWLGGAVGFFLGLFIWWISRLWFFIPLLSLSGLFYDYLVSRNYKEYRNCKKGVFWCAANKLEKLKKTDKDRRNGI